MDSSDKSDRGAGAGDPMRFSEAISLLHRFGKPDVPSEGMFSALGMLTTDAILDHDDQTLVELLDGCKRVSAITMMGNSDWPDETTGRLLGFIDIIGWATRRVLPLTVRRGVEPGTHAHSFLRTLMDEPGCTSTDLAATLGVHASEISRVGSKLESDDLVRKVRVGRAKRWSVTPRGVMALNLVEQTPIRPQQLHDASFHSDTSVARSRTTKTNDEGDGSRVEKKVTWDST